jgi:glycine/D-amino acid oxidase-like deaminating enzyme
MATIAVIGGGIVGCAAAAWLIAEGHQVTVFERAIDERPASTGNAGLIALPEITPLARPGVLASVPGWLLDPLGPCEPATCRLSCHSSCASSRLPGRPGSRSRRWRSPA